MKAPYPTLAARRLGRLVRVFRGAILLGFLAFRPCLFRSPIPSPLALPEEIWYIPFLEGVSANETSRVQQRFHEAHELQLVVALRRRGPMRDLTRGARSRPCTPRFLS